MAKYLFPKNDFNRLEETHKNKASSLAMKPCFCGFLKGTGKI